MFENWQPQFPEEKQSESPAVAPSGARPAAVSAPLLDLSAPERWVDLRNETSAGVTRLVHYFSTFSEQDAIDYELNVRPTILNRPDETSETRVHLAQAGNALWLRRILRVMGYHFDSEANWRDFVPLEHRALAVIGLGQVEPDEEAESSDDTETLNIVLRARWNGVIYDSLAHRFRRPAIDHQQRWHEATARFARRVHKIGGQRRPQPASEEMFQLPNLPTLLKLYDELIVSTEGYQGTPMDVWHKRAAVGKLFDKFQSVKLEPLW